MQKPFQKVILFGKRHHDKAAGLTLLNLKQHLEKKNISVFIEQETAKLFNLNQNDAQKQIIPEEKFHEYGELIIVIGGDGSFLSAARAAAVQKLPILGINRGRLGFLADIAPDDFDEIDLIINGKYQTEERFLLKIQVIKNNKIYYQNIALNDIVLLPGDNAQMIEFSVHIDEEFMYTQRADGLIMTTPTGSTAYALSGGGPILHPQLDAVALVPMFPHKLTSRPVVISGNSQIEITVSSSSNNETLPRLSCDGQTRIPLEIKDKILVQKFDQWLTLIHPEKYQYFSTLRKKLQWENKPY